MALEKKYKIVMDGAGDAEIKVRKNIVRVPMKTAEENGVSPSPSDFFKRVADEEHIYVITASPNFWGSFDNALCGKEAFLSNNKDRKVHVFNSQSVSGGEGLAAEKIIALENAGKSFEDIVFETEKFISETSTYIVPGSLSQLKGVRGGVKNIVSAVLDIELLFELTDGEIIKIGQTFGLKRAVSLFAEKIIGKCEENGREKILISHSGAAESARRVANLIKERGFEVNVIKMGRLSAYYIGEGGMIAAF